MAQNLVANPDFATSLDGWSQVATNPFTHDASQGSPAAGSALGTFTAPGMAIVIPALCVNLHQCVPVVAGRRYQFGARCSPAPGQSQSGSCDAQVTWVGGCGGITAAHGTSGSSMSVALGPWTQFGGAGVAPDLAEGAELALYVCASSAAGPYQASIDHAFLYEMPAKGDFDDDGQVDLVLHNDMNGDSRIWLMNGVTRVSTNLVTPDAGTFQIVGSDDFDGDGKSDLVLRDPASGQTQFWLMNGAAMSSVMPLTGAAPPPSNWRLAASGDFNHDGHPDLLWRNNTSQQLVVWLMNGGAKIGGGLPNPDHAIDSNWSVAAALDFDNDGNRDLLWYNSTSGKIVLWRMDANVARTAGEFTSPPNAGDNNWQVLAGGDYGAGAGGVLNSKDIVWRNATSGKFVVWHMDPDSVPLTRTSGEFTTPDGPTANPTDWTLVGPK